MNAPTALAEHETIGAETATPASVWETACAVDDLEPSWGEAALLRARQIALFLVSGEEIYAVAHRDPHTDAPVMARGIVGSRGERPTVASPLHKEVYDLATGECFTNPELVLQTFRTRVVRGMIEVELPL
ncbi:MULTISPECIES: nitrite reductase small subunit NirD [unclassified Leifsonia]|uniref:nitrite reductase small subunit NirD n=1 Tax=unclassified Leifsonia TaxID=2663824 RepID=UPI0009E85BA2|nr:MULTISPECIES: nitrite reductase small subunit NirD [unclassified Leifsonia]